MVGISSNGILKDISIKLERVNLKLVGFHFWGHRSIRDLSLLHEIFEFH